MLSYDIFQELGKMLELLFNEFLLLKKLAEQWH